MTELERMLTLQVFAMTSLLANITRLVWVNLSMKKSVRGWGESGFQGCSDVEKMGGREMADEEVIRGRELEFG